MTTTFNVTFKSGDRRDVVFPLEVDYSFNTEAAARRFAKKKAVEHDFAYIWVSGESTIRDIIVLRAKEQ